MSALSLLELQDLEDGLDKLRGVKANGIFSRENTKPQVVIIGKDGRVEYYCGKPPKR